MEFRRLTGTGINVSRICLGTMTFGDQLDEKDSISVIRQAIDCGVNFIDTANTYSNGQSEVIVGKGIKHIRDKVILATKIGYPLADNDINDIGLSRRNIIKGMDACLKRLDTDYVDLFYIHHPIYGHPVEETYDALSTLVRDGKVRYLGVSNMASWQLCEALWKNDVRNGVAPAVTQNTYNLLSRGIDSEMVPFIQHYKLGLVVYNPLAGGLLTGKHKFESLTPQTRFTGKMGVMYKERYWTKENFAAIDALEKTAREIGSTLVEFAMSWVASRPYVDSIITGVSRVEQLAQNINAIEKAPLNQQSLELCDKIWADLSGNRFQYNR